ncbi:YeeE/YedE family protein [Thiomonas bhubaneswarensis]|jgi:uncharacterized membrane protein YedE/YeeE|uniref:Uncharacterized membrane protein YedE/YeeE, contains two sulfur transport domains n=1 Tax=Thiomonas bhubaneswarensis TaxID=339866 RepID=A0A0K6I1H6_9BURK|nr:YeeE/YedE thiosulfate transporter family protein [Thiomonas bhubaneswarensis]CUA96913.1 Uncharacterized membrane protein YedE/YeeE, contains two sulfur transport domains [Thiomonas bhubaneswarensis]
MFHIDYALFAPWHALAGGVMIGAAAGIMALLGGKVMGCSGIAGGNLHDLIEGIPTQAWRWSFLLGVLLGTVGWLVLEGPIPGASQPLPWLGYTVGGLAVGFGTRLGSGCTSGHGVCGIPRLSQRSLVAVACFFCTAMLTVFISHHLV